MYSSDQLTYNVLETAVSMVRVQSNGEWDITGSEQFIYDNTVHRPNNDTPTKTRSVSSEFFSLLIL